MTERPVAGEPSTPGPVLVPRSSHSCATWPGAISRTLTSSTVTSGKAAQTVLAQLTMASPVKP
jgi:hypothetical protein